MPKLTRRTLLLIALVIVVASLVPTVASAVSLTGPQTVTGAKPAIVLKTGNLGKVLATPARFGIYTGPSRRRRGQDPVHRTVRGRLAARVRQRDGAKARQGCRSDLRDDQARHEAPLTINGLPAYTYHHDPAGVVLCDDVNGWFAVRPL